MMAKWNGLSHELLSSPGDTIKEILVEREIEPAELAVRTNVSLEHIIQVLCGKKGISATFAQNLEYALGIKASFWMNLQAIYDQRKLELDG